MLQIVECLQCGHSFELKRIYNDDLGNFTVCPKCEGSFDIELTEEGKHLSSPIKGGKENVRYDKGNNRNSLVCVNISRDSNILGSGYKIKIKSL